MLAPIPVSVMPSVLSVRVPVDGVYGGEYAEAQTIENVRFEKAEALVRGGYVLTDGAKGLLFVDAVNSKGAFEIPTGSLLSIDGAEEATAGNVATFEGFNGEVHHWEIEVM